MSARPRRGTWHGFPEKGSGGCLSGAGGGPFGRVSPPDEPYDYRHDWQCHTPGCSAGVNHEGEVCSSCALNEENTP